MKVSSFPFTRFLKLLLLSLSITTKLASAAWSLIDLPIPVLNAETLQLSIDQVDSALEKIATHKIIWIMGKFKVGKTWLVDYIKKDKGANSNALNNTIGLKIWHNGRFAIIDTEGLMQPVGENNPFFVKEFLTAFMARTADVFVYVTDQMDVVDLEYYKAFRSIFWGTEMYDMFHVHNCKTLSLDQLDKYKTRIKNLLSLSNYMYDEENRKKPVQHLFIPKIEASKGLLGLFEWFTSLVEDDDVEINKLILGQLSSRRQKISTFTYFQAVNDGFRALGSNSIEILKNGEIEMKGSMPSFSEIPVLPEKRMWCKPKGQSDSDQVYLFIETSSLVKVDLANKDEVSVTLEVLDETFRVKNIELRILAPVHLIQNEVAPWRCYQSSHGYAVLNMTHTKSSSSLSFKQCPSLRTAEFSLCSVNEHHEDQIKFQMDDVLKILDTANNFLGGYNGLVNTFTLAATAARRLEL